MFKKINDLFDQYLCKGLSVTALVILSQCLFLCMLQYSIPTLREHSKGLEILDLQLWGYTPEYIHTLFAALGSEGRSFYLTTQLPIDIVYPFLFGISNSALLLYLFKKLEFKQYRFVCFLPLIAALFDYLENMSIAHMLFYYPDFSDAFAIFANIFTLGKVFISTCFYGILMYFIVVLIKRKFKPLHKIDITV